MTLSVNSIALETPGTFLAGRTALTKGTMLLPYSINQVVNGLTRGISMMEATQNVAKRFSTVLRDAGTGLGALLTPAVLSSVQVQIKKGGLVAYSVITPTLTSVGTSGLVDVAFTSSHLDTLGVAAVNITGPGLLPNDELFVDVVAFNKNDPVRAGLTSLPNASAGTSLGLPLKQDVDAVSVAVNAHTDAVLPSPAAVRDAVLDALLSDHSTPGTVADGIAIAAGLLQGNFMMDNVINGANGLASARLRVWRAESGVPMTGGGTGEGEFAEFQVLTTYTDPGKVLVHRVVRVVGT